MTDDDPAISAAARVLGKGLRVAMERALKDEGPVDCLELARAAITAYELAKWRTIVEMPVVVDYQRPKPGRLAYVVGTDGDGRVYVVFDVGMGEPLAAEISDPPVELLRKITPKPPTD